jgi:hypothetical protein
LLKCSKEIFAWIQIEGVISIDAFVFFTVLKQAKLLEENLVG